MSKVVIIEELIDTLPFRDALTWEKYQSLCTDVLYKLYEPDDSREYLSKGNKQQGIDIYAVKTGNSKLTVAQCKLVDYLGPKQTIAIIDEFLIGNLVEDTKEFILCTSADLARQRDEEETLTIARNKLAPKGIGFTIWDQRGLSRELRTNATEDLMNIVYRYFGPEITKGFYGEVWNQHLKKLTKIPKPAYASSSNHIERTISSFEGKFEIYQAYYWSRIGQEKKHTIVNLFEFTRTDKAIRAVLLSIAGFGKTEETQRVASYFSDKTQFYFPIKFSLCNYRGQAIEQWLEAFNPNWRNISEETLLLIFDGLDEITEDNNKEFIRSLNAFVEFQPKVNILVSSRFNSYNLKHEPLVAFQVYTLDPLTHEDIDKYLISKLSTKKDEFTDLLQERNFSEFIQNPYYLTRMVRFFSSDAISFPKNKSDLFDRILFEQLDNDKTRFNKPELKNVLLPLARKIAFCMTVTGKGILNDAEISTIIPNVTDRESLKHFSILIRNDSDQGSWSFEHKNLQEYLCASCLSSNEFHEIHEIISFTFDKSKLKPNFLNTISFLFEIVDKTSSLFRDLFNWLNTNDPELLVRFEKEQLSKAIRKEIFRGIFAYYKNKGISIRFTSNFQIQELADFAEIDGDIINFLADELKFDLPSGLQYDALRLLSFCKKPYLYRQKILDITSHCLRDQHNFQLHGACIDLCRDLGFNDQQQLDKLLKSGISVDNFFVRKAIINLLEDTEYFEDYANLILSSIEIFEIGEKQIAYGAKYTLARLILRFTRPNLIKKVFQRCILQPDCLSLHHHHREFKFSVEQTNELFNKAKEVYSFDSSIVRTIYRLFRTIGIAVYHDEVFGYFLDFFDQTCGRKKIFFALYKHTKVGQDFLPFAFDEEECCEFLIGEYQKGKITDGEMIVYRNNLSWKNTRLCNLLHQKLVEISAEKFHLEDIDIDYNLVRIKQEEKNETMLVDKALFLDEANDIFNIISKEQINNNDLWFSQNRTLWLYQFSIVLFAIRDCCHDNNQSLSWVEFREKYDSDVEWDGFVVDSIKSLLEQKKTIANQELIAFAKNWCTKKITETNFNDAIKDFPDGTWTYIPVIEYIKKLVLLLSVDLSDALLLKLLLSDWNSFYSNSENENTISAFVAEKISDKDLLKTTVLKNIKGGTLATGVLCSHYQLCHKLRYKECRGYLFDFIVSNERITDYNKITLSEYYIELGGEIEDFRSYITIPEPSLEQNAYHSWTWFIIERLRNIEPEKITEILLKIANSSEYSLSNKILSIQHLIELHRIEGLVHWIEYVKLNQSLPFDHRSELLYNRVKGMPTNEAIKNVFDMLDHMYETGLHTVLKRPDSIEDILYGMLFSISSMKYENYLIIKKRIEELVIKYAGMQFVNSIKFSLERLTQLFFEKQMVTMTTHEANLVYMQFFSR